MSQFISLRISTRPAGIMAVPVQKDEIIHDPHPKERSPVPQLRHALWLPSIESGYDGNKAGRHSWNHLGKNHHAAAPAPTMDSPRARDEMVRLEVIP